MANTANQPTATPDNTDARTAAAVARIRAIRNELAANLMERDDEANGLAVAYLAQRHVLLLGPPGGAKSLVSRLFAGAVMPADNATTMDVVSCADDGEGNQSANEYFQRLLGAFTTPEEVMGPYDLSKLEAGVYERCVDGYLPTAKFAELDEIFNANQSLLTTLNTILEEREYDHGTQRISVPLRMAVGAANRYPDGDMAMEALYDRFSVRHWVAWVEDEDNFVDLLAPSYEVQPCATQLEPGDAELLIAARKAVEVPEPLLRAIYRFKVELAAQGIECSTRRWKQSVGLIQAQALINGNAVAQPRDCMILADSMWSNHEERPALYSLLTTHFAPTLGVAQATLDSMIEAYRQVDLDSSSGEERGRLLDTLAAGLRKLFAAGEVDAPNLSDELQVVQAVAAIADQDVLDALRTVKGMHDNVSRSTKLGVQALG